jgi:histidyl-tRNA synthetase
VKGSKELVIREIDKLDKLPESEVRQNLKKYKAEKVLDVFKRPESYFKKFKSYAEIEELKKYCSIYKIKVSFLPSLARGLSYYNGSVFEIKTPEIKETICAGGSYLVNNIQSTGISFGLDRLSSLAKVKLDDARYLVISIGEDRQAIELVKKLREAGRESMIMFGKPSRALEYADSYKIPFVIFLGKEELKKKKVKLRDMKTGKEKLIGIKELLK